MTAEEFIKVRVDLPNHWAVGGESLWAIPLGEDKYRIENVPFFAYGINYQDVVYAIADSPELKPEIKRVVETSGHKTFRVIFEKVTDREKQVFLLESLEQFGASYERADALNVAIDVKPTGKYNAVYDQLEEYIEQGCLSFETCEPRVEGSFDDFPE